MLATGGCASDLRSLRHQHVSGRLGAPLHRLHGRDAVVVAADRALALVAAVVVSMTLTWDEVRARSEVTLGNMTLFCGDCAMVFPRSSLPCRKHATPEVFGSPLSLSRAP